MSSGDSPISAGTPRKLHHRIDITSFSRCASMSFAVTFETRAASGIFLLSNLNSQKPEGSGVDVLLCASKPPNRMTRNTFIIVAPGGQSTVVARDHSNHT